MSDRGYRPRVVVEVSEEQLRDLNNLIPWGMRNTLMVKILDDLIDVVRTHGLIAVSLIIAGKLPAQAVLPTLKEMVDATPETVRKITQPVE